MKSRSKEVQMKVVVVYESMFGNTRTIGEGIAEGLTEAGDVRFGSVDEVSPDETGDAALIVAGGPTHAHGMARPNAHQSVAKMDPHQRYGPVLPGRESLRGWLERLGGPCSGRGLRHAVPQAGVAHGVGREEDRTPDAREGLLDPGSAELLCRDHGGAAGRW